MTTGLAQEDPFDEVERGIDWLERLESIKARQDREAAIGETVEYVNRLRHVIASLSGDASIEQIAEQHGQPIADIVASIRDAGKDDPWDRIPQACAAGGIGGWEAILSQVETRPAFLTNTLRHRSSRYLSRTL